jgi:hypothetical protein
MISVEKALWAMLEAGFGIGKSNYLQQTVLMIQGAIQW